MTDVVIYTVLALLLAVGLALLSYYKNKNEKGAERAAVPRPRAGEDGGAVGAAGRPPNRVAANRNARARMRAAAQRHEEQSDEDEVADIGESIALPEGKIGKKKMAKLQAKSDRRAMREAEEREREEKKQRAEKDAEERKKEEKREAEEEAKKEEEEQKAREEKERQELEEYLKMKEQFEVEEEGFDEGTDQENTQHLLNEFVSYIKNEKVVVLEDLAAKFKLKTQDVINRINDLLKEGTLTGVIDDRGKFIYICMEELQSVAKFIRQRGRVSISDLAEASNTLITLVPETSGAS